MLRDKLNFFLYTFGEKLMKVNLFKENKGKFWKVFWRGNDLEYRHLVVYGWKEVKMNLVIGWRDKILKD